MKRHASVPRKRDYKKEYRRKLQLAELREQQLAPLAKARKKKRRNYKDEYRKRKLRDIAIAIERDARRVFGIKPKRGRGEGSRYDPSPLVRIDYAEVLAAKKKRDGKFNWEDEDEFIGALTDLGMPTQEAYTLWFSP
jgi:hypothetical protein